MGWRTRTESVLSAVLAERERQVATYGHNETLEDGTGPSAPWLQPFTLAPADVIEKTFRQDYEEHESATGQPTWAHLVREEVAEAFAETDPRRLAEELIQVAALCVSWVEKIHDREGVPVPAQSIEVLDLSVRVRNALQRNGIETLTQLCDRTLADLFDIRNMGYRAVDEVRAALQREGLALRNDRNPS